MLISALVCFTAAASSVEAKADFASQANSFAFSLANKLNFAASKKNELISPISVGMDFTMLLNGTTGKTHQELAKALGWSGSSLKEVNEWYASMLAESNADSQMVYANAIFSRDIDLKSSYVQSMKRLYSAELDKLPALESDALAKVNGWVNEHTKKRIPRILEQMSREACIVMLNAVTFDGKWDVPFNATFTKQGIFNSPTGTTLCHFMNSSSNDYRYSEDSKAQYLQMGYRGGRYAMLLALPVKGTSTGQVLTVGVFEKAMKNLKVRQGQVSLPKFRFSEGYNLIPPFEKLGVKRLFEMSSDYGNMAPRSSLAVSQAAHRGFIEVNEQGTKAGAATAIVLDRGMPPPPEFRFVADRPFAFALYDTKSGTILFLGVVNKPTMN